MSTGPGFRLIHNYSAPNSTPEVATPDRTPCLERRIPNQVLRMRRRRIETAHQLFLQGSRGRRAHARDSGQRHPDGEIASRVTGGRHEKAGV